MKKDATNKFQLSDWVEMTDDGRKQFRPPYEGTVTGFSRDKRFVRITKRNQKSQGTYHPSFWYVVRRECL